MDNIVNPRIEEYMRGLQARHDEPVLLDMEREGAERNFPIVGRSVGVTIELLARAVGARRVFELGSGFGYWAYWFSRAVGPTAELHLTDSDPVNERRAMRYLARAGLDGPVRFHVGEALASLGETDGVFDVVYCDVNKQSCPERGGPHASASVWAGCTFAIMYYGPATWWIRPPRRTHMRSGPKLSASTTG